MKLLLALLYCNTYSLLNNKLSDNSSPKVVIVGAGAAGIAAASRLLENGFTNIKILEAEDRIGGRVHSLKVGHDMIDMGGQWVHGEEDNVAFEVASPLGLIEGLRANFDIQFEYFTSYGTKVPVNVVHNLLKIDEAVNSNITDIDNLKSGSFGEYAEKKYLEYFRNHPDIPETSYEALLHSFNLAEMMSDAADNWYDVSAKGARDYPECIGDFNNNWINQTYSMIFDILMKKYPDPKEELPVMENIHMNCKVTKISYNKESGSALISTANGEEYSADHIIFTPSLGVLKKSYQELFDLPLSEIKIKAIENIGFGHVAKIWLYYEDPWWDSSGYKFLVKPILWTDDDKMRIKFESKSKWMLGIYGVMSVEHKPNFLCLWVVSDSSIDMESVPEKLFQRQVIEILKKFYGRHYHVNKPTKIIRTKWNTNENFLGTYSFRSVQSDLAEVSNADLSEPIMVNNKPILQFAGEATAKHYATVHGAIESGWREADRLIDLYTKNDDLSQFFEQLTRESKLRIH